MCTDALMGLKLNHLQSLIRGCKCYLLNLFGFSEILMMIFLSQKVKTSDQQYLEIIGYFDLNYNSHKLGCNTPLIDEITNSTAHFIMAGLLDGKVPLYYIFHEQQKSTRKR